ncbi:MAG: esterase [Candidatus Hydrogenedentota bacterium]
MGRSEVRLGVAAILVVLTLTGAGCSADKIGAQHGVMIHEGLIRSYRLYLPYALKSEDTVPLLIGLHGSSNTSVQFASETGFDMIADANHFIFACPDAIEGNWGDGRHDPAVPSQYLGIDDVDFIRALVEKLIDTYPIDPTRVYITGISNGGMMALRLACEASDVFAAAAPVMGNMPMDLIPQCKPAHPMPIQFINGMSDPIVPYAGGYIYLLGVYRGRVESVDKSVAFWAQHNACDAALPDVWLPDVDANDGTQIWKREYLHGTDGAEVVLYAIHGGGHDWPSHFNSPIRELFTGNNTQDINASQVIWEFLSRFRRQEAGY